MSQLRSQHTMLSLIQAQDFERLFEQDLWFQRALELRRGGSVLYGPAATPLSAVILLPHSPS